MDKLDKWKQFVRLIKNTLVSSKKLTGLINKYLTEQDEVRKRLISEKIDYQFEKHSSDDQRDKETSVP